MKSSWIKKYGLMQANLLLKYRAKIAARARWQAEHAYVAGNTRLFET